MKLRQAPVLLFDDAFASDRAPRSRLYNDPLAVIEAHAVGEVQNALAAADRALKDGYYLAGWIGYEAGAAFEPRLMQAIQSLPEEPLIWLGIFEAPTRLSAAEVEALLDDSRGGTDRYSEIEAFTPEETEAAYKGKFDLITAALHAGDVYQVNHTFSADVAFQGDPLALYARLRKNQPVSYGAYIDTGDTKILSFSPELFLRSEGETLCARPMKGTLKRGLDIEEDDALSRALASDVKSRAENLMIVDLLRNDLSRIAVPGSVEVPSLFDVERYKTVLQMTSTVTARRKKDVSFGAVMAALFPCGSITGAPKIRAMELIAKTEQKPRGVYTGSMGWADPGGDFCFNVAIRTLIKHGKDANSFRLGLGSGIVTDSCANAEYEECLLKARFLEEQPTNFSLIETIGWTPEKGYSYLARHLRRMAESAAFFGFSFDKATAKDVLKEAEALFSRSMRVRLMLGRTGHVSVTASAMEDWPSEVRVFLSDIVVDRNNPFVRHKTTYRDHFGRALKEAEQRYDAHEVVFLNNDARLCEGARSTLFVQLGGVLYTPPVRAGLLPGVLRSVMIESGRAEVAELDLEDLRRSEKVFVGNSVRGLGRAIIIWP